MRGDEGRGRQLDLFGAAPRPARRTADVGPAAVPAPLAAVAARLPPDLRLGTSSWSFPGWSGIVYDRQVPSPELARGGLAAYARHPLLRAVGIDRTFYEPLPATAFAEYAAAVPSDFRFLVKAASLCTTPWVRDGSGRAAGRNERFLDSGWAADEVVGPAVEGLGAKAGVLLFQFSPLGPAALRDPPRFAARLAAFLSALPAGVPRAVELRDRDLLCPEYFEALAAGGATHCVNVHPRMPDPREQWHLAGADPARPLVVRWMLHAGLDYENAVSRYEPFSRLVDEDPVCRETLADLCLRHAGRGAGVILVANNKAEGSAPLTVFRLAERIAQRVDATGL